MSRIKAERHDTVTGRIVFISDSQAEALAQLAVSEEKEISL